MFLRFPRYSGRSLRKPKSSPRLCFIDIVPIRDTNFPKAPKPALFRSLLHHRATKSSLGRLQICDRVSTSVRGSHIRTRSSRIHVT